MVNQICIGGLVQALAEAIDFAQRAGLDTDQVLATISKGAAQSWQMENRWRTMAEGVRLRFRSRPDAQGSRIVLDEARRNGAALPVTALVDQFYRPSRDRAGGNGDTSSLILNLRSAEGLRQGVLWSACRSAPWTRLDRFPYVSLPEWCRPGPILPISDARPPWCGRRRGQVMDRKQAKFTIGQVVKHRVFPFRGVIFDVDPVFSNSEEWYEAIPADVRPSKDQPFYHLLAENAESYYVAYVSEQNLLPDAAAARLDIRRSSNCSTSSRMAATSHVPHYAN